MHASLSSLYDTDRPHHKVKKKKKMLRRDQRYSLNGPMEVKPDYYGSQVIEQEQNNSEGGNTALEEISLEFGQ